MQVKLLPQDGELYVFAQSADRVAKERAMRRRQLKWLWARLKQLSAMRLTREELLMKLGAARHKAPTAWRLVEIEVSARSAAVQLPARPQQAARRAPARRPLSPAHQSHRARPRQAVDLSICNSWRWKKRSRTSKAISPSARSSTRTKQRIEAHIFIAFLAYCLHVTLKRRLHALAPGLTPRSVLEKFAAMQMIDVHVPTTDGRELLLTRYTQPEPELRLMLDKLKLELPAQPPPKITAAAADSRPPCSADLHGATRDKSIT